MVHTQSDWFLCDVEFQVYDHSSVASLLGQGNTQSNGKNTNKKKQNFLSLILKEIVREN